MVAADGQSTSAFHWLFWCIRTCCLGNCTTCVFSRNFCTQRMTQSVSSLHVPISVKLSLKLLQTTQLHGQNLRCLLHISEMFIMSSPKCHSLLWLPIAKMAWCVQQMIASSPIHKLSDMCKCGVMQLMNSWWLHRKWVAAAGMHNLGRLVMHNLCSAT